MEDDGGDSDGGLQWRTEVEDGSGGGRRRKVVEDGDGGQHWRRAAEQRDWWHRRTQQPGHWTLQSKLYVECREQVC